MNHFLVNSVGFKQSETVLRFALGIFTSEEVDAFEDCIGFTFLLFLVGTLAVVNVNGAACALDEGSHAILNGQLDPFVEIQVQHEHLV